MFLLLFGSYFLFCVLKLNPWLAAAGALAFTFSSYNIILSGGWAYVTRHLPLLFLRQYWPRIILVIRASILAGSRAYCTIFGDGDKANHIQMTYYLLIALSNIVGIEFYHAIRSKTLPAFFKSYGLCWLRLPYWRLAVNASILWSTYEYSKDQHQRTIKPHAEYQRSQAAAYPKHYAYEYSQGVGENFNFSCPECLWWCRQACHQRTTRLACGKSCLQIRASQIRRTQCRKLLQHGLVHFIGVKNALPKGRSILAR